MHRHAESRSCGWKKVGHWSRHQHHHHHRNEEDSLNEPLFGVRRPLRFMAHKLDLDEDQISILAKILGDLKTERAQAAVDRDRSLGLVADLMDSASFDEAAADAALQGRVLSAERLRDAVKTALARSHAMLKPEQRRTLAYLLRSGVLSI